MCVDPSMGRFRVHIDPCSIMKNKNKKRKTLYIHYIVLWQNKIFLKSIHCAVFLFEQRERMEKEEKMKLVMQILMYQR